jgi:hypothetical protein
MMLERKKPLAAFCDVHPKNHDAEVIPEQDFAPYVEKGTFIKREHITASSPHGIRRVLYALPGEEWRIDAYLLLWETAEKAGWSEGFERMEGRLLGYEDWQIDFHIENRFKKAAPHFDSIESKTESE